MVCVNCKRLRDTLNSDAIRFTERIKLIEINKYLKKHLRADTNFYYSKEENHIKLSVTLLIGAGFFK